MFHSLKDIQTKIQAKQITVKEIVKYYLENIKKTEDLNAFLEVFEDEALAKAELLDKKISEGKAGRLHGMVLGLKDNICYKDHKVTASSKILEGFTSLFDSTAVERVLAEDAIIIGRLNCDEFAMGGSNETSAYGNVLNPIDKRYVPGGSSGGSAVAVAADCCLAALGSDTGGSVRQPASYCGIIGLKPTYGRVSRWGLLAYASSFDQIGPLAKNIDDAALILETIAGVDQYDSTASEKPVPSYSAAIAEPGKKKLKIAYLKEPVEHPSLDPEVRSAIYETVKKLEAEGHQVDAVPFPEVNYVVPAYYVLTTAEASSNLARYDGIHYGYRSKKSIDLEDTYVKSRSEGFGIEVKRRIMTGTFVLSAGYYDAYYSKGQKVRRIIQEKTVEIFNDYDFIILPTTRSTAFKFGENTADPIKMYLEDIFTVHANLAGIPAVSLPLYQHSNGLPFGLQVYAKHFGEAEMLQFSKYVMSI